MLTRLMRRLRDLLRPRARFDRELSDELQSHVDHRADDLQRAGLSPREARRRARIELGSAESFKDEIRRHRSLGPLGRIPGAVSRDFRFAARRLRQSLLFAAFAILTLGLGIGAVTAAYSGMYVFAFQPRGFDARGLVVVASTSAVNTTRPTLLSGADFVDLVANQRSLAAPVAWRSIRGVALAATRSTEFVEVETVSGGYFDALGVPAALGRPLQPADDDPEADSVAVLSDAAWRNLFDSDEAVVGSVIRIGGHPVRVVGVAPSGFRGLTAFAASQVSAWVPLAVGPRVSPYVGTLFDPDRRASRVLYAAGRLTADASVESAAAELATVGRRFDDTMPLPPRTSTDPDVARLPVTRNWSALPYDSVEADAGASEFLRVVLALPFLVLLVACTNLTNLFLSRGATRGQEFAVRTALGASRWQLIRGEMAEAAIVGTAGALLGVGVAHALLVWLANALEEPMSMFGSTYTFNWHFDPVLFAATASAGLLAVGLAGVVPAFQLTRPRSGRALNSDTLATLPRWRGRSNLIALQVGVSVALFLVAAVCVRFIVKPPSNAFDSAEQLSGLVMAGARLDSMQIAEPAARVILARVAERVRQAPGVRSVAVINGLPEMRFGARGDNGGVARPDRPFGRFPNDGGAYGPVIIAEPAALSMVGVELRSGRVFDERDVAGAAPVVVLSDAIARELFGPTSPVDQPVLLIPRRGEPVQAATVIGVVSRRGISSEDDDAIWLPFAQQYTPIMGLMANTDGTDRRSVVTAIKDAARAAAPDLALVPVAPADMLASGPLILLELVATAATGLGTLALALTMSGLYGVLSHVVSRRRREMGLRMALGAERRDILHLVLRGGFRPVVEGLFIGLASALLIRQIIQYDFTSELSSIDVAMFGSAALPLIIASAIACYLPARSASRVDPNVALRDL